MSSEPISTVVSSPCIGVCAMNEETGLCEGCFRTIDEIREWWDMSSQQRHEVKERLAQRQIELARFDD
ncbi:MAG TPA: DUF1289 domain-containing protein [Methylovorus sp.]|jgi:uncharacterized protein|nr:DUF1289 domain-containing protein [Methylovorus sp.]